MDYLKGILGLLVATLAFGFLAFVSIQGVASDYRNQKDFALSETLKAKTYRCTNYMGIVMNSCTATYETRDGREGRIEEWRFGRAPGGTIQLMQSRRNPAVVATTAGINSMLNRIAFSFVALAGALSMMASLLVLGRRALVEA